MFISVLLVVAGLAALYQGGNALVAGAAGIARAMGIPPLIVGLTVVAFCTSAPELAVSVIAAFKGNPDIAVGNVLGSNTFNVLVAVGVIAFLSPFTVPREVFVREVPFNVAMTLLVGGLAWYGGVLGRLDGLVLVFLLNVYLAVLVRGAMKQRRQARLNKESGEDTEDESPELDSPASAITSMAAVGALAMSGGADIYILLLPLASLLTVGNAWLYVRKPTHLVRVLAILLGLGLLVFGSDAMVVGASDLATRIGVSEATVGLTVVAIGTSAPELATAILAVRAGANEIAVGNALGSNIFNLLCVLGTAALIHPVEFSPEFLRTDLWVTLGSVLVLVPFGLRGGRLPRWSGAVMVLLWLGYSAWRILGDLSG